MAATPYRPLTWSDEPIFTDKLQQMCNNDQWLFENAPRMYYDGYGIKKNTGVKIMASILVLGATNTGYAAGTFNFGSFFSAGCKPVIVMSLNPLNPVRNRFDFVIRGIGSPSPDHRGFRVSGASSDLPPTNIIADPIYINFIAVGW